MSNKLLLADDSITIQKVVGIIFANEDYELTVVDNGTAALAKARLIKPDVLLIDALMPGKSGYEVCSEVRQDPLLKETPILLLTGAFEPFDAEKAKQSGADDYISKPFESQQLIDRVKNLVELGEKRRAAAIVTQSATPSFPTASAPAKSSWEEPPALSVPSELYAEFDLEPATAEVEEAFANPDNELPIAPAEEIFSLTEVAVEGTLDDDLWGAFDVEEVSAGQTIAFGHDANTSEFEPSQPAEANAVEETVSFADEESDVFSVEPVKVAETQEFDTGWEPVGEQTFALVKAHSVDEIAVFAEEKVTASVEEFKTITPHATTLLQTVKVFSQQGDAPQTAREDQQIAVSPAVSSGAAVTLPGGNLTQEQLAAAISQISREVIEKIVWEVVPDLAEVLIQEEIRKLKAGFRG